ncbi:hypothetical protein AAC387_Pa08g1387 [Persea americana]
MMANRNPESSNPEQGDGGVTSTLPVLAADQQPSKPGNTVFKSGPLFISSKGIGWTSWKKRWFILTRTSLVFFRSDPNALPQKGSEANLTLGGIDLNSSGSVVVKADKKLLIVLFPDGRDGRTFTLKAETLEDLYEWKDALENALAQAPSGAAALDHTLAQTSGGSLLTGQSGVLLQDDAVDTIEGSFEQSTENQPIKPLAIERPILLTLEDDDGSPSFLEKALGFIEQYGVKAEGILRQAADVAEVERRIQEYEQGRNEFSSEEDAHVIADCVKHILRASPPIPASCCTSLLDAFKTTHGSRVNAMRATISETFLEPTRLLLKRILKMMQIVASHKSENLMSTPAVAACMAPLLLRPLMAGDFEVGDDFNMGGDSSLQLLQAAAAANHAQAIVITLMEEFRNIFFEDSSSTESYSEGSGSEEEALTGDEVSEDGDYDDEEDDIDIEIEDDYDAESDFHSETDDGDEENDFDLEEEDDPECNLSGSSGERSCKGSGADNRKVSEGLDSDSHSPEVIKGSKDNDKPPTEIHTPPHWHNNSQSSSNLLRLSDNHSALPAIETRSSSVDASANPVLRSRNVSRSSSIPKSTVKQNEPKPNVKRPAWGRAPGRKNLSMESIEFTTEDEVAIQKLESTKADLQSHIEKEAKENRVLQESLERRKQDLHRRRLALEQDVARLQDQLQKERELRATLESALTMPLGNLPISSTLDHKMKAEIEELALAETAVINLTQKAADLQVQLNQRRQDNHVAACQSCKALHQEKIKDEQKDIQTTAGERHHESSPMHEDCPSLSNKHPLETDNENAMTQDPALSSKQHSQKKQIDSTSHNKTKAMGMTTDSQNVATQDPPSSSNKQPSTKLQTDMLRENNNKTNSTGDKTSLSADRVNETFSKKQHSQKKQLGSKSHNKTKSVGKTASLSTDADNVATQDSPSLSDKRPSKKPQPDLVSENSMTKSTGDTTSLLTDCEDAVMQNPALSSKQTSQKKQIDSTSHNKTKAMGTTPSLSTDSQNVATQDNSSLSNKQTPKKLQPDLVSETSTKSTNAKSSSPPKELPTVVRNTSSSKKTTGKVEGTGSGPSTLTRLANRLNFLKERRNQIAHELQLLRASNNPETKSDK